MNSKPIRRKCRHCRRPFSPDYRNRNRQCYCSLRDCRRTSKGASQRRWLRKTANRDHFRGSEQTQRVQEWRKAHPGYWRKSLPAIQTGQFVASQTINSGQASCNARSRRLGALQDVCLSQNPVFIGLLSVVTGSTLQDDIAATIGKLLFRGQKILGLGLPDQHHSKPCDDDDLRQLILPGFVLHD